MKTRLFALILGTFKKMYRIIRDYKSYLILRRKARLGSLRDGQVGAYSGDILTQKGRDRSPYLAVVRSNHPLLPGRGHSRERLHRSSWTCLLSFCTQFSEDRKKGTSD